MTFQRITRRILPDGKSQTVYPFHVCTEGKENRVVCRDSEDLRVAYNFIPICARRSNVLPVAICVLNSHMHSFILASSFKDACRFGDSYKRSYSKYFGRRYGHNTNIYLDTDSTPILLEDDKHVRNAICYIFRNSIDAGFAVNKYIWSSFGSLFCDGQANTPGTDISAYSDMKRRSLFKTADHLSDSKWLVDSNGVLVPESFCDWKYAESAFFNNKKFFLKVMGLTDDEQMKQILEYDHLHPKSIEEVISSANAKSLSRYGVSFDVLSLEQKIPIIKTLYHSLRTTPAQLARSLGLEKGKILWILGKS